MYREPYQLVPLPRDPTAASILASFLESKEEKGTSTPLQLRRFQELMEGIRMYFDRALPLILLYRHEREQYEAIKAQCIDKDFKPSEVYGAEHLLRLFVRLPHLLAQTAMNPQEVTQVSIMASMASLPILQHSQSRCPTNMLDRSRPSWGSSLNSCKRTPTPFS